jgi:hypothetical protein
LNATKKKVVKNKPFLHQSHADMMSCQQGLRNILQRCLMDRNAGVDITAANAQEI